MNKTILPTLVILFAGCTKQEATDITKYTSDLACAVEQAELADPEIEAICHIAHDILGRMQPALEAQRRTLVRRGLARSQQCKDAGAQ